MAKFTKAMTAAAMVAALTTAQAMAAEGTLTPGKPAGVQSAQSKGTSLLLIGGAAIVTVIAVVVASQQGHSGDCGSACTVPTTAT